jgi:cytochrome b
MKEKRLVWDLPTRLFHWLLVASILASYLTADPGAPSMKWHMYLGYWTLGLVIFRVLWGFVGPKHARFSQFVKPGRVAGYLATLFRRDSAPTPGHNPIGGLAVVVMLLMVAVQAVSGLFISDDIVWSGPWYPAVGSEMADRMASIHHTNFDVLLWVIGLHVLTMLFYAFYKRQDLVGPMITGYKKARIVPAEAAISSSQLLKALVIAVLSAAAVYAVLAFAPPPVVEDYY